MIGFLLVLLGIVLVVIFIKTVLSDVSSSDVSTHKEVLAAYSRDISVFMKRPQKVYFPRSVAALQKLVSDTAKDIAENGIPKETLTVRAGGTCMSGGPLTTSAVVDLTRHLTRVSIDPKAKTATVEMGAYFRDIEDAALKYGLMFAPYPSSKRICGIGGMIGNNASGEKSVRFGATGDNILSMEVVLADGTLMQVQPRPLSEVTDTRERAIMTLAKQHGQTLAAAMGRVPKAASGYRLDKVVSGETFNAIPLFAGAQGTLGIVTKAVLKLVPIPSHLSLLAISAQRLEDIPIIVEEIHRFHPEAIETFDKNTFAKAREHLSEHANRLLPYVDESSELFILAEFSEDTKEATANMADECRRVLTEKGYKTETVTDEADISSIWEVRRNSFLLMRDHNPEGYKAVPCIEDVIVPIPALATFIGELHQILIRRGINYGFHGHIGDGSLRIVPVFDWQSPTLMADITGLMREVFALVKRLEGNISADHSDGLIRSPFLREFYGDSLYQAFADIKHIYDPKNIFNPGKKVGVTESDLSAALDLE